MSAEQPEMSMPTLARLLALSPLSIDEKTQIQALDRTQPLLPIEFGVAEKRTHDYVRRGTTNLFAALNVGTGEVLGACKPTRNGADFLAFLKSGRGCCGSGAGSGGWLWPA
jgi:hypothetical protein